MLIHLKATPILETYSCNFIRIDYNRFDEMSSEKKVFLAKKGKKQPLQKNGAAHKAI